MGALSGQFIIYGNNTLATTHPHADVAPVTPPVSYFAGIILTHVHACRLVSGRLREVSRQEY